MQLTDLCCYTRDELPNLQKTSSKKVIMLNFKQLLLFMISLFNTVCLNILVSRFFIEVQS